MELSAVTALALGLIFVGSYENDVPSTIIQTMMERDDVHLNDPWSRYLSLGLALLYLGIFHYISNAICQQLLNYQSRVGKQDAADATIETVKTIEHPIGKQTEVLLEVLAYAGNYTFYLPLFSLRFC